MSDLVLFLDSTYKMLHHLLQTKSANIPVRPTISEQTGRIFARPQAGSHYITPGNLVTPVPPKLTPTPRS
jgi:hypothetical protein